MAPAAWQAEHDRLERAAADAMRARDGVAEGAGEAGREGRRNGASAPAAPAAPTGFFGRHPQLVGAAWGGAVVVFFGALGLWLSQDQKPREAGETATGTVGRGESGGAAAPRTRTATSRPRSPGRRTIPGRTSP